MPQGNIDLNEDGLYTSKINAIANGKTKCSRFRLPKGKLWYIAAFKDDDKDRKRIRISRFDDNDVVIHRYIKPHTLVIVE